MAQNIAEYVKTILMQGLEISRLKSRIRELESDSGKVKPDDIEIITEWNHNWRFPCMETTNTTGGLE